MTAVEAPSSTAARGQPAMRLTLKVWRQADAASPGKMVTYEADDI